MLLPNFCHHPALAHRRRFPALATPPTSVSTSTQKEKGARGYCASASTSVPTAETTNTRGNSVRRSQHPSNHDWIQLSFYASSNALLLTAQSTIYRFCFRSYPITLSFSHVGDVLPKPIPRGIPPQLHCGIPLFVHLGLLPNQPRGIPPWLLTPTHSPLPKHSHLQRALLERKGLIRGINLGCSCLQAS